MRSMIARVATTFAALMVPGLLLAQVPTELKVGDMAPDFTLPAATMRGVTAEPVKLSSLRGKTVVLAFFPRARTAGCTKEMQTYRDQYADIFDGGKAATLIAMSNDSASVTAKWAAEESFPFTFVADVNDVAAKLYGTATPPRNGNPSGQRRDNIVIGPDGRISAITRGVLPADPTEYTKVRDQIKAANKK